MKRYLFVVFKTISLSTQFWDNWIVSSEYPVTVPDGADDFSMEEYATILLNAERVISSSLTAFTRVIVLELTAEGGYDMSTKTHLFVKASLEGTGLKEYIYGIRDIQMVDPFCGIEFGWNRKTGRVPLRFLPHSFSVFDSPPAPLDGSHAKTLILDTDSDLSVVWFPLYVGMLSTLPYLDQTVSVSHDGVTTPIMPITDAAPILCHASLLGNLRRRYKRRDPQIAYWEDHLEAAFTLIKFGYVSWQADMSRFNYTWGDGVIPESHGYEAMRTAAVMWYHLADGMGYNIPDTVSATTVNYRVALTNGLRPIPGRGTVTVEGAAIEKAIQWWYAVDKDVTENNFGIYFTQQSLHTSLAFRVAWAKTLYDLWPRFQEDFQAMLRAACIIRVNSRIKFPPPNPLTVKTRIQNPHFDIGLKNRRVPVGDISLEPLVEVTIPGRGPYFTTPHPNSVYVHLPKEKLPPIHIYTPDTGSDPYGDTDFWVDATLNLGKAAVAAWDKLGWTDTDAVVEVGKDWATDLIEEAPEIIPEVILP